MTEDERSDQSIVEEWLMEAESVAASIPSWIASPRHDLSEIMAMPLASIELALARASVGPAPVAIRSSLVPALMETQISTQRDDAPDAIYPDLREENRALRTQLAVMAVAMARLRTDVLEASEGDLVALARAIAERVTGRELLTDPALAVAWAREASEALGAQDEIVVVIAPDLAALIPPAEFETLTGRTCRVEIDPSLGSLACEVRTRTSVVDASIQGRLAAIDGDLGVAGR